ncbi:hypothetical protein K4K49_011743 [Colletotrichum sp. SAR 10_70]|nr:hypothetical protein K4K50_011972 [Colletotrichum sp. SAR 10_71]KAI8150904.1 hypothetical protein K4K49_011743 [Colletotrichum sp. SAR 10_70]KAI8210828.1 hypothetical protein K4K53_012193 [Colletotrichum sp. SAR 10_77]
MAHSGPIRNGPIPYPKADPLGPELGPGCCGTMLSGDLTSGAFDSVASGDEVQHLASQDVGDDTGTDPTTNYILSNAWIPGNPKVFTFATVRSGSYDRCH